MPTFDWHKDQITLKTTINKNYKNTQNVRRFFKSQCGEHFKFDRSFMKWMKEDGLDLTMGDAVQEWLKRQSSL